MGAYQHANTTLSVKKYKKNNVIIKNCALVWRQAATMAKAPSL